MTESRPPFKTEQDAAVLTVLGEMVSDIGDIGAQYYAGMSYISKKTILRNFNILQERLLTL